MNSRRIARSAESGVTLMELLIAMTLLSLLSVGIVISLRVGMSAMNKADTKLMANRRVASVQRIIEQQIEGIVPVATDCHPPGSQIGGGRISFFQGESQSMRFVSTYSLQQGSRGLPMILEFQVVPGENAEGVRLVVNERIYAGPVAAGSLCLGMGPNPLTGVPVPRFVPIEIGPSSFVLADKLAACRFSFRDPGSPQEHKPAAWVTLWTKPLLPNGIRIEVVPLNPDASRLEPVTLTVPVHVTRRPLEPYENN